MGGDFKAFVALVKNKFFATSGIVVLIKHSRQKMILQTQCTISVESSQCTALITYLSGECFHITPSIIQQQGSNSSQDDVTDQPSFAKGVVSEERLGAYEHSLMVASVLWAFCVSFHNPS
jgi:hypothetical protein